MCMFIVAIDARGRTNTSNKYTNTTNNNNNKQYHQKTKQYKNGERFKTKQLARF